MKKYSQFTIKILKYTFLVIDLVIENIKNKSDFNEGDFLALIYILFFLTMSIYNYII